MFTVLFLSRRGIPESQAQCCLQKQKTLAGSAASLKVTCYVLESWVLHRMDPSLFWPAKSLGQAIIFTQAILLSMGWLIDYWKHYFGTLVWFWTAKSTYQVEFLSLLCLLCYFSTSRGIPESQAECCLQKHKNPSRLSCFTESDMLCTRELSTAQNGSRFVLVCKITGPSHYFYPNYLAFNGLADWLLKTLLWDPCLVLNCEISMPSRIFIKQWPLAGEFVEFGYSPKIRHFWRIQVLAKMVILENWPDLIRLPTFANLFWPDSIHSPTFANLVCSDSLDSRKPSFASITRIWRVWRVWRI